MAGKQKKNNTGETVKNGKYAIFSTLKYDGKTLTAGDFSDLAGLKADQIETLKKHGVIKDA